EDVGRDVAAQLNLRARENAAEAAGGGAGERLRRGEAHVVDDADRLREALETGRNDAGCERVERGVEEAGTRVAIAQSAGADVELVRRHAEEEVARQVRLADRCVFLGG